MCDTTMSQSGSWFSGVDVSALVMVGVIEHLPFIIRSYPRNIVDLELGET